MDNEMHCAAAAVVVTGEGVTITTPGRVLARVTAAAEEGFPPDAVEEAITKEEAGVVAEVIITKEELDAVETLTKAELVAVDTKAAEDGMTSISVVVVLVVEEAVEVVTLEMVLPLFHRTDRPLLLWTTRATIPWTAGVGVRRQEQLVLEEGAVEASSAVLLEEVAAVGEEDAILPLLVTAEAARILLEEEVAANSAEAAAKIVCFPILVEVAAIVPLLVVKVEAAVVIFPIRAEAEATILVEAAVILETVPEAEAPLAVVILDEAEVTLAVKAGAVATLAMKAEAVVIPFLTVADEAEATLAVKAEAVVIPFRTVADEAEVTLAVKAEEAEVILLAATFRVKREDAVVVNTAL